jgi:hypothetical protein
MLTLRKTYCKLTPVKYKEKNKALADNTEAANDGGRAWRT